MTETQVKRGRGRPKKVFETVKQTEQITMEDIKKAMEEIVNERFEEEHIDKKTRVKKVFEQPIVEEVIVSDNDVYSTNIPMIWNGFFNILTRIYESNEESYECVKYNMTKNCLLLDLDANVYKNVEDEIGRIKVVSCYHSLNYSGKIEDGRMLITISM